LHKAKIIYTSNWGGWFSPRIGTQIGVGIHYDTLNKTYDSNKLKIKTQKGMYRTLFVDFGVNIELELYAES